MRILAGSALLAAAFGAAAQEPRREQAARPPNVLVLLTDDQRFGTVGALGHPDVRTPNVDRLVARGTTFTHAHIMGGLQGAVCAPSRAMLLTGRGLFALRAQGNVIPPEHPTFPEAFRQAGYTTFFTGKWHNDRAAFARAWTAGAHIFHGGMHWPKEGGHETPWLHAFDATGAYPPEARRQVRQFSSTLFADAAVSFLERQDGAAPFLAYVAFTSPHDPRTPPDAFARIYDPARLTLPPNVLPEHPFDNGELAIRDEALLPRPLGTGQVRRELAAYYGMISEVDAQIGRILDALERHGHAGRTIVVFASDNGLAVGSHGLLGKQNLYDESVRVPLVLAGPGIPAGERRDALAVLTDIFPTLADLSGVPVPAGVDGASLLPSLRPGARPLRDAVLLAYRHVQRGLRTSDGWKVIEYRVGDARRTQLFDMSADPWEMRDLASSPAHHARLTAMRERLRHAMRAAGDPLADDRAAALRHLIRPVPRRLAHVLHAERPEPERALEYSDVRERDEARAGRSGPAGGARPRARAAQRAAGDQDPGSHRPHAAPAAVWKHGPRPARVICGRRARPSRAHGKVEVVRPARLSARAPSRRRERASARDRQPPDSGPQPAACARPPEP